MKKNQLKINEINEADRQYIFNKFKKYQGDTRWRIRNKQTLSGESVVDPSTGLNNETIKENIILLAEKMINQPHQVIKAKAFEYATRNIRIDVSPHDWFVAFGCWNRNDLPLQPLIDKWENEVDETQLKEMNLMNACNNSGAAWLCKDFCHSVPDWDVIFKLGFPGIREHARCYQKKHESDGTLTPEAQTYFDGIEITYSAIIEMLERFRTYALQHAEGNARMSACADCLKTLIHGAPTNTYECLQLIYLYFMLSEYIDLYFVRSRGNLDQILYPFYIQDLKDGRYSESQIREFIDYFLLQWSSIDFYWGHPLYLGGTRKNGESAINELSYLILEEYDKLGIYTPKIQLKTSANTPEDFIDKAFDMIRRGHNSLVFVGEEPIKRALMGVGVTEEEARTCTIWGCYEFAPKGRCICTIPGTINLLKPIELAFNNGIDPVTGIDFNCRTGKIDSFTTFDDFYAAYIKQLDNIIEKVIVCSCDFEKYSSRISPAQMLSATVENSLHVARDAFQDGSIYNFSLICEAGFATAVDALMAVRIFVYEKQVLTLEQFREILRNNWAGHEKLRLKVVHDSNKFGNGIDAVDCYAEAIASYVSNKINMRPSARNGIYVTAMESSSAFIFLGEKTGATPDGRLAGEEISKNISPTMGMDVRGVTSLIKSVTRISSSALFMVFPLDVMLHPLTVHGEEGLTAMRTLLKAYMSKHGIAIHFNVFDAQVLIDAQKHPEKYEGLQVRVCGWNVRFTDIAKKEQDEYIKRALNIIE